MRILFGLCGVGLGHATRSRVVLDHLASRGHVVLVAASGQAHAHLAPIYRDHPRVRVIAIVGFVMACREGSFDLDGSLEKNLALLPTTITQNADAWATAERFAPEAAITDYDSFAWLFARARDLPTVSIGNHHVLTRCVHDPRLLAPYDAGLRTLAAFTETKAPECRHYIVTSFFYPPVTPVFRATTTLVPPILRAPVLDAAARGAETREHVLVYKTVSLEDDALFDALRGIPSRFVVYGASDRAALPPNCQKRAFSETGFVEDLRTCRAVVGNGGMSLLGEAVALGKPVYAVPVREQYEQILNGLYLAHVGYGVMHDRVAPSTLTAFLETLPRYRRALVAGSRHDGNATLRRTLDTLFG